MTQEETEQKTQELEPQLDNISQRIRILDARPDNKDLLGISVSKAKTFKDCKAKYRYTYIEKLPQKEWEFLTFGKFVHEVLESFYKIKMAGSTDPANAILTSCWKTSYANWKEKMSKESIAEAKQILMSFLEKQNHDDFTVLGVEKSFYIDIDGRVLVNGFIDRVQMDKDGVIHVADYKTTKNPKYLKKDFFQLLTYAFIMCLENPEIKKVRGSYILLRHDFESIVKEFDRDEIMKIEGTFLDYADKIKSEKLFRANPTPLCAYCSFVDVCEGGSKYRSASSAPKFGASSW